MFEKENSNPCSSLRRDYWPGADGVFGHVDERRRLHEAKVCDEI